MLYKAASPSIPNRGGMCGIYLFRTKNIRFSATIIHEKKKGYLDEIYPAWYIDGASYK